MDAVCLDQLVGDPEWGWSFALLHGVPPASTPGSCLESIRDQERSGEPWSTWLEAEVGTVEKKLLHGGRVAVVDWMPRGIVFSRTPINLLRLSERDDHQNRNHPTRTTHYLNTLVNIMLSRSPSQLLRTGLYPAHRTLLKNPPSSTRGE
jgi:hypothetical protein